MTKWHIDNKYTTMLVVADEDNCPICTVECRWDDEMDTISPTNQELYVAELIRSAPELKECLQDLCTAYRMLVGLDGAFDTPLTNAERILRRVSERHYDR